jgi:hypothetical protein
MIIIIAIRWYGTCFDVMYSKAPSGGEGHWKICPSFEVQSGQGMGFQAFGQVLMW